MSAADSISEGVGRIDALKVDLVGLSSAIRRGEVSVEDVRSLVDAESELRECAAVLARVNGGLGVVQRPSGRNNGHAKRGLIR